MTKATEIDELKAARQELEAAAAKLVAAEARAIAAEKEAKGEDPTTVAYTTHNGGLSLKDQVMAGLRIEQQSGIAIERVQRRVNDEISRQMKLAR